MSLSQDVKKLEDKLAKLKGAVQGNCVLVNREGFCKPMFVDDEFLHGRECTYGYRPSLRRIKLWERRENSDFTVEQAVFGTSIHSYTKEVTYHNTGRLDGFGRVMLEEMP